ncbi:MAG: hypothetical protein WC054_00195 [Candidatus Nanopelagicales bacterium]
MTSTSWSDETERLEASLRALNAQAAEVKATIDAMNVEVRTTIDGNVDVISSHAVNGRTRHRGPSFADLMATIDSWSEQVESSVSTPYADLADEVDVKVDEPEPLKPPSWDPLGMSPHLWNLVDDLPKAVPVPEKTKVGMLGRVYSVVLVICFGTLVGLALMFFAMGNYSAGSSYAGIAMAFLALFSVHQKSLPRLAARSTGLQAAPCVWCNDTTVLGVDAARTVAGGRQFLVCKPCQGNMGLLTAKSRTVATFCLKCAKVEFCSVSQSFGLGHKCFDCYAKSKKRRSFAVASDLVNGSPWIW